MVLMVNEVNGNRMKESKNKDDFPVCQAKIEKFLQRKEDTTRQQIDKTRGK